MSDAHLPTTSEPATPKWIAGRIETLLSHYYQPATDEMIAVAAMKDWIGALSGFSKGQISGACELYLRQEPKRRPTPADIRRFILEHRQSAQQGFGQGDRSALSFDEQELLVSKVLPNARRWLSIPDLREHGLKTLAYWGEQA